MATELATRRKDLEKFLTPGANGAIPLLEVRGGLMALALASAALQLAGAGEQVKKFHRHVLLLCEGGYPTTVWGKAEWGCWLWSLSFHVEMARYPRMPRIAARGAAPVVERLMTQWPQPEAHWYRGGTPGVFAGHLASIYGGVVQFDRWVKVPGIERFLASSWEVLRETCRTHPPETEMLWSGVPYDVFRPNEPFLLQIADRLSQKGEHDNHWLNRLFLAWYWLRVNKLQKAQEQAQPVFNPDQAVTMDRPLDNCLRNALSIIVEFEFARAKRRLGIWQEIPLES